MRFVVLIGLLVAFVMPSHAFANEREVYVALGDSLAAGQTPFTQIDAGYTDFIALQLQRNRQLASFSKELTFPGYRVENVIESVQTDTATALLEKATLVTISAGANNLLPLLSHNATSGTLAFNQLTANFALNEVRVQVSELLQLVRDKAPNANIYIMGYYFPYVSVHEEQEAGAREALQLLNQILQQQAEQAGVNFVDVYETFNAGVINYLTNLSDVHPNQQGYRIMANKFLEQYSGNDLLELHEQQMPQPNPLTFEQILQLREQEDTVALARQNYVATVQTYPVAIYV